MTWYKDNGVYVDTQAQAVWFDSDISSSSSAATQQIEGNKGFGYGLSVETGKRIALKRPHWSWTPQMQLAYSNVDFDSFSDVGGTYNYGRNSQYSLYGELGISTSAKNFGDSHVLRGEVGFRYRF